LSSNCAGASAHLPHVSLADVDRLARAIRDAGENGLPPWPTLSALQAQMADRFVVTGTAVNIRKFKVTASTGYVVNLSLENAASSNGSSGAGAKEGGEMAADVETAVVVPVLVGSDLCAAYLDMPAAEYLARQKGLSKEEGKELKVQSSLRFQDFRGSFVARLLVAVKGGGDSRSQLSSSDSATLELLERYSL
jgi:hypothetical protein